MGKTWKISGLTFAGPVWKKDRLRHLEKGIKICLELFQKLLRYGWHNENHQRQKASGQNRRDVFEAIEREDRSYAENRNETEKEQTLKVKATRKSQGLTDSRRRSVRTIQTAEKAAPEEPLPKRMVKVPGTAQSKRFLKNS